MGGCRIIIAAIALLLAVGPEVSSDRAHPVVEVQWTRAPSSQDYLKAYPETAWRRGRSGQVTLSCLASATGALGGCSVVKERPTRVGFGVAALHLAPRLQGSPTSAGRK